MRSVDEYVELMGNLKLPNPKMMDVAVPANMHVGLHQDDLARQGLSLNAREAIESLGRPDILLVDLRENSERAKHGMLPGALHAPYPGIDESLQPGGMLREVAAATGRRIVFFCAFGERSAMAVAAAKERRPCQHRPYRRRHRRLEEGRRPGDARVSLSCRRSPDGAQRNPGPSHRTPDFASLHPGYDITARPASTPRPADPARPPASRRRIRSAGPE